MSGKKTITVILLFLGVLALLANFRSDALINQSSGIFEKINTGSKTGPSGFYLGTFHFPNLAGYHSPEFFRRYDELSYNSMIGYISHQDSDKSCSPNLVWGGFYDAINPSYTFVLDDMITRGFEKNYGGNFSLLLEREKILRPAYGQSSVYRAEYEPAELSGIRPSYGFHFVYGDVIHDSEGIISRRCLAGKHHSGYMLKQLAENLEQVNFYTPYDKKNDYDLLYNMSDRKSAGYRWYVKPRMRIDPVYAAEHMNTPVVTIKTLNYSGDVIDSTVLTCGNFGRIINGRLDYKGNYTEHFYKNENTPDEKPFFISVTADRLCSGVDSYKPPHYLDNCKVDYQVYWHGIADVYIESIKVEDEWAHRLLTAPELLPKGQSYMSAVNEELELFKLRGYNKTVPYFYLDEFNYNNIPCIAFVNKMIREKLPGSGLAVLFNDYLTRTRIGSGLVNGPSAADNYEFMFSSGASSDVFLTEIYPFDDSIPLPASIPVLPDKSRFKGTQGYRKSASNNEYNDRLNYNLERGFNYPAVNRSNGEVPSYMDRFRKFAFTRKNHNLKILGIAVPFHTEELDYGNGMREPTVEEMRLMCSLAIAYGANAVYEFSFGSSKRQTSPDLYSWGIDSIYSYVHPCNQTSNPRVYNYYGQKKYEAIIEINSALRKTGDFIYRGDGDNLVYLDTRTVNDKFGNPSNLVNYGLPYKYIASVSSLGFDASKNEYSASIVDAPGKQYWEIAFFGPRASEQNPGSKYFYVVNKRCAPGERGIGDFRTLKIEFDTSQLIEARQWTVKDAITGVVIFTFDKNTTSLLTLGEFMPGEGRLFILEPAK